MGIYMIVLVDKVVLVIGCKVYVEQSMWIMLFDLLEKTWFYIMEVNERLPNFMSVCVRVRMYMTFMKRCIRCKWLNA